jgi:hypothetical protein
MGRPEEPLERDGSPVREFAFWLRDLRRQSGLTYEQLAARTHYATSTVQAASAGRRLPTLRVMTAFVAACEGDEQAWRAYWARIRRVLDAAAPGVVRGSVLPPWLDRVSGAGAAAPGPGPRSAGRRAQAAEDAGWAGGEIEGWFIQSYTALVRVDAVPVEVIERRTIVATAENLSEIVAAVSVPRHPDALETPTGLDSELLYGGSLELRRQPYDSYFMNVIALPRPLRAGERHEYSLRLRIPPGQRMASHYLYIPHRRSDEFALRVRFSPERLPRTVWLLDGAPTAAIYQREPCAPALKPDRFGEVEARFEFLRPGLGYGVRWREPG